MLNTRIVAAGETGSCFNNDNLRKTYGGQLNILSETAQVIAQKEGR